MPESRSALVVSSAVFSIFSIFSGDKAFSWALA